MLAGLAPILGNGVVGGAVDREGGHTWSRVDGPAASEVTLDAALEWLAEGQ